MSDAALVGLGSVLNILASVIVYVVNRRLNKMRESDDGRRHGINLIVLQRLNHHDTLLRGLFSVRPSSP